MKLANSKDLRKFLDRLTGKKDLDKLSDEAMYPSGTDAGLVNVKSGAGVHARDDNAAELSAGKASVLVDGSSGVTCLTGEAVALVAKRIVLRADPNAIIINNGVLNPVWLPTELEALSPLPDGSPLINPILLKRSPLVFRPAALTTILSDMSGAPVPVMSLFEAKPLFKTSKFASSLAKILKTTMDG